VSAGPAWTDPIVADRMAIQGVPSADSGASIAVVAASVAAEKPDLATHAAADGTVTLMFTDLGDSTALNEELGDRAWFEVLQTRHDQVRSLVEHHGGSTVKSQGGGFMLAFPSVRRAVECAIAVQRAASKQKAGDHPLSLRIGIHTGEVLRQGEDFFGRHVNLAARGHLHRARPANQCSPTPLLETPRPPAGSRPAPRPGETHQAVGVSPDEVGERT
jgi:class 3 adenylate cyclase